MSQAPEFKTPYYAHFEHPDGSWYLLWITHTQPRTERGHPWHVHASFDKHGALQPIVGADHPALAPYGMHNWDFDTQQQASDAFGERVRARLDHGYQLVRGQLPDQDPA